MPGNPLIIKGILPRFSCKSEAGVQPAGDNARSFCCALFKEGGGLSRIEAEKVCQQKGLSSLLRTFGFRSPVISVVINQKDRSGGSESPFSQEGRCIEK
jgi:hypothetical protein